MCGDGECDDSTGTLACTCPATSFGASCDYRRVLLFEPGDNANLNSDDDVVYAEDLRESVRAFDRVAYRMALDDAFSLAMFDATTDIPAELGVPVDRIYDSSVSNLVVESSDDALDTAGVASDEGTLQFWSNCYREEPFGWDHRDTIDELLPDCDGLLGVYDGENVVMGWSRWSSGARDDLVIGGTEVPRSGTANTFTDRALEVYVRETRSCEATDCGAGTCSLDEGVPVCACPESNEGLRCQQCAFGYNDDDHDGVCARGCAGEQCDDARVDGLATGVHAFQTVAGELPLFVDNDYDGGGWILMGRGRHDWRWTNEGRGDAATIPEGLGTPAAFEPAYLSSSIIQQLLSTAGASLQDIELRVRRAANVEGTEYQEVLVEFRGARQWDWQFDLRRQSIDFAVQDSVLGGEDEEDELSLRDALIGNDHRRMGTWAWDAHDGNRGFFYGGGVDEGDAEDGSFLWQLADESHPIPYAEVFIRLRCAEGFRGRTCNRCGFPRQRNDGSSCQDGCALFDCAEREACDDRSGTAACVDVMGESCADILSGDASATDGVYAIDPDGAGPLEPLTVECDMSGGGWTIVTWDRFDTGYGRHWSHTFVGSSDCQDEYGAFLGRLGLRNRLERTFWLHGIPHSERRVQLDTIIIDSWDGEELAISIDGEEVSRESYALADADEDICASGWDDLGRVSFSSEAMHSNDQINLVIVNTLDEGPNNEAFGIDDVRIAIRRAFRWGSGELRPVRARLEVR